MRPIKIDSIRVQGRTCTVFSVRDPGGGWSALRIGEIILVRSLGDLRLDAEVAKSFARAGT